ncbi:conserved Plasmodium protein, unknown function [Plasmodium berghei]|uniref:Uncharacterized protein n=2 Tax=Plasmodium berghei TaxID=5821 RepID=A0A509AN68_PLABA|nr:conserved protein, unknown function [Plasmodium berghei ANKA]CXI54539.1 conserved Plasmodium protein, unknown function [Plasmodium berghei]SCM17947.1 conserved Plasmodium protein, unknown function [Plasmodium berghei]SCN26317.1 conserved Plasmodium protein, unknown function [Plasmodium berghei]VUC56273.1 conserved protein, unknown function [Plasmodium berghei ANKA]|eukprot:XP_034422075.1 conserved protein, unknown function [Plasmodium berghei ANKA]
MGNSHSSVYTSSISVERNNEISKTSYNTKFSSDKSGIEKKKKKKKKLKSEQSERIEKSENIILKNCINKNNIELLKTKNRAKRYIPSKCLLRNCIYWVNHKINNKIYSLMLELKNEPQCKIVVISEKGNIIKNILIKDIEVIESSLDTIDIFLRVNNEYTNQKKFCLCSFTFKNNNDKAMFIHNIKNMYGLDVLEYGTIQYNKINTQEIEEKYIYENNVLNMEDNNNSQVLFENMNTELFEKNIDKHKVNEIINTALELGQIHNPVIILGDMQYGDIIKVKELNSLNVDDVKKKIYIHSDGFTLIEWFLSKDIGSNNKFRKESIHNGNNLLLKSYMIGYFIKVKVSKNIYVHNKKTFVTSINVKGPVTINDNIAKQVLDHLTNANEFIQIYLSSSDIYNIFFSYIDPKTHILGLFIFYPAYLFIMRTGLRFAITLNKKSYSVDFLWNSFYLTKKDILFDKPTNFVPNYMDISDIHLYMITKKSNGENVKSIIRTNSASERDIIYATIFFCKYQKGFVSIDQLVRDSLVGSFSHLKKKFQDIFIKLKGVDIKKIELYNKYGWKN